MSLLLILCSQGIIIIIKDEFNFLSSHAITFKGIHHLGVSGELPVSAGYPLTQRDHKSALMDDVPKFAMVHTVNTLSIGCIRTIICLDWPRLAVPKIPSVRTLDTQSLSSWQSLILQNVFVHCANIIVHSLRTSLKALIGIVVCLNPCWFWPEVF